MYFARRMLDLTMLVDVCVQALAAIQTPALQERPQGFASHVISDLYKKNSHDRPRSRTATGGGP